MNRSKQNKEAFYEVTIKFKPYSLGLQVSHNVESQIPKKVLYGRIREKLVSLFNELANRRGSKILEGHLYLDYIHMVVSIPPKYGVAEVVGYLKGKGAEIKRRFEKIRKITGASFWARGYFVSTVRIEERDIRLYIRNQEKEDREAEQLKML